MDTAVQATRSASAHTLETENLCLRIIDRADVTSYVGLLSDPEVMKYIGVDQGKLPSLDEVAEIVDGAVIGWKTRGYGRWSIFERVTNKFVGFTGFRCEEGVPELLSVIHERFWGNGYAQEAGRACVDYAFANLGFTKITANTRPANTRARALVERLGFDFKGIVDFHGVEGAAYEIS